MDLKAEVSKLACAACKDNSTHLLEEAVLMVSGNDLDQFHRELVRTAIENNSIVIIRHLVQNHAVTFERLSPESVATTPRPSIQTLELLLAHGWDVNHCKRYGTWGDQPCDPFLWLVISEETLVRWCLEHGARVTGLARRSRPILEIAAAYGAFATFKLLHAAGAPLGRRTLHLAIQAASCGHTGSDDPEKDTAEQRRSREKYNDRIALVFYLLDVLCLDVNAADWQPGDMGFSGGGSGSPISYAIDHGNAKALKSARSLIWLLLDRGADPTTALQDARANGLVLFAEYVDEWKEQEDRKRAERAWAKLWNKPGCCLQ